MTQYIDKSALIERIKKLKMDIGNIFNEYDEGFWEGRTTAFDDIICELNALEVKEENSIWHNIDDTPNYNLNGISDFIIDSCYGHIYGEAHSYTPEQWSAHIGFNANRQFRWAYEKDLINFE